MSEPTTTDAELAERSLELPLFDDEVSTLADDAEWVAIAQQIRDTTAAALASGQLPSIVDEDPLALDRVASAIAQPVMTGLLARDTVALRDLRTTVTDAEVLDPVEQLPGDASESDEREVLLQDLGDVVGAMIDGRLGWLHGPEGDMPEIPPILRGEWR